MKNSFMLLAFLTTTTFLFGQALETENYKVYSALIKAEILDSTKSITIIKKLVKDTYCERDVEAIKSKDIQGLEQLRFWTRDGQNQPIALVDSTTKQLIVNFCETQLNNSTLSNLFNLNVKVHLVNKLPFKATFRKSVVTGWKRFYQKYPGSGGLFRFSNVYYSPDKQIAILYHTHQRNGLNGHGALTVMIKLNREWRIKYQTYYWQD